MTVRFVRSTITAALGLLVLVSVTTPVAYARPKIAVTIRCTGRVSVRAGHPTATRDAHGACRGTLVGTATFSGSGSGSVSVPPCAAAIGWGEIEQATFVIKSASGTITLLPVPRTTETCAANGGVSFGVAAAAVSGGTAKFEDATGFVSISGRYNDRSNVVSMKLTGYINL